MSSHQISNTTVDVRRARTLFVSSSTMMCHLLLFFSFSFLSSTRTTRTWHGEIELDGLTGSGERTRGARGLRCHALALDSELPLGGRCGRNAASASLNLSRRSSLEAADANGRVRRWPLSLASRHLASLPLCCPRQCWINLLRPSRQPWLRSHSG
jgi:hypothetical protein